MDHPGIRELSARSAVRILRRLRLASVLALRWIAYVITNGVREPVLGDFSCWMRTTFGKVDLLALDLPWVNFPAGRWLAMTAQPEWHVFEWGSGASTLF